MVGIAGVFLTGCVLMVIILKYGRNSKFGIKGDKMRNGCLDLAQKSPLKFTASHSHRTVVH